MKCTMRILALLVWLLSLMNTGETHTTRVCNVVAADGKSVKLYAGTYHTEPATQGYSGGILLTPPGGSQTRYNFNGIEGDSNDYPPYVSFAIYV